MPLVVFDGSAVGVLAVYAAASRAWTGERRGARCASSPTRSRTELELAALAKEFEAHRLRFELAIDAAQIGSFDWDLRTGRLVWDDRLVEIFGYTRGTFDETIEAFRARMPSRRRRPRRMEALQTAIDSCGEYEAEFRVVLPSGETRWMPGPGARPGRRRRAPPSGWSVPAYDTTGQRHGDARVARVLEAMNAAFFSLDREWRFTYVNAEAERVLGRTREELLGGSIWELFPAAVGSDFEEHYRGAAASGQERVFEAYYPAPLESWYEVRAWPSPDGLSVYFLDVSERRAGRGERAPRARSAWR